VGSLNGNGQSLALHWNGSIWSRSATPSPDAYENFLNGVLAMSSNNVWAVGQSGLESFVVHWNGARWSRVKTPNVLAPASPAQGVTNASFSGRSRPVRVWPWIRVSSIFRLRIAWIQRGRRVS